MKCVAFIKQCTSGGPNGAPSGTQKNTGVISSNFDRDKNVGVGFYLKSGFRDGLLFTPMRSNRPRNNPWLGGAPKKNIMGSTRRKKTQNLSLQWPVQWAGPCCPVWPAGRRPPLPRSSRSYRCPAVPQIDYRHSFSGCENNYSFDITGKSHR